MTCLIPTLSQIKCEVAFQTAPVDTPVWVDVTPWWEAFSTSGRGRTSDVELSEPCTATIRLDNSDGRFDADNINGPYYSQIKANAKVRISALFELEWWYVFTGYADSWTRTWPGGAEHSMTELRATDRYKLLARRENVGSTLEETTADRVSAILLAGGYGAAHIIPAPEFTTNPEGYACRTVVERAYNRDNTLDSLHDMELAEGGSMFMDAEGIFRFRSTRYRTDNTRSTTSQATFGNYDTAIPVEGDLSPTVDMDRMTNWVTITDVNGTVKVAPITETSASIDENGPLMLDLGNTMLLPADAQDRVNDVLALRQDPTPRYDSLTIDAFTNAEAMEQALKREVDDRVTVAVLPPRQMAGMSRPYFIEGIRHDVDKDSWRTTFTLSPAAAGTVIP